MIARSRIGQARRVHKWADLGVELPDNLTQALELFDVIQYTEVEHRFDVDIESVTADNVEGKIAELAEHLVKADVTHYKTSPMAQAKVQILDKAARRVLALAGEAVPSIVERITPAFDQHVAAYVEAASKLPGRLDNSSLVGAGSAVPAAFADARIAAAELRRIDDWVGGTRDLPGCGAPADPQLGILRPRHAGDLQKIDEAQERSGFDATDAENAVGYIYLVAARRGIPFGINLPKDRGSIRAHAESAPTPKIPMPSIRLLG